MTTAIMDTLPQHREDSRDSLVLLKAGSPPGFTLVELLVVVAVIAILAGLLLPALSQSKMKAQGIVCMNNLRQIQVAWGLYTLDFEDRVPPNINKPEWQSGRSADFPSWVAGWLSLPGSNVGPFFSSHNTNTLMLVGSDYRDFGSIGGYATSPGIYKCPSDKSKGEIEGQLLPRVRTLAMNANIGVSPSYEPVPRSYRHYRKTHEFKKPSEVFVFLDEREDSINDGGFYVFMDARPNFMEITDYPAHYHNGSGSLVFADGHAEFKKWKDPRTIPALNKGTHLKLMVASPDNPDVQWLIEHSSESP